MAPQTRHGYGDQVLTGLERLSPDDAWAALCRAREELGTRLRIVVDSAPNGPWNADHQTVRPIATWRRLLNAAGLEILDEQAIDEPAGHPEEEWARAHWRCLAPFRDEADARPRSFLVRAAAVMTNDAHIDAVTRTALGAAVRQPPPGLEDGEAHVVFLVGTHQEFRQYLPLWRHLPRERFSVLLREAIRPDAGAIRRVACTTAWLEGRRIDVQVIASVQDIDWNRWVTRRRALVCGADSTAFDVHLWNAAVVVAAKRQGFGTVQLQHGIWPYADLREPMTLTSDVVLTWSDEFERALGEPVTWPDGRRGPRAVTDGVRFLPSGCPVFDPYAETTPVRLEDLLGDWVSQYRRRVLVATNLHWSQHTLGTLVNPALLDTAKRMPDTLFVLKPHPVHDVDDAFLDDCPGNIVVLDEFCCLFADLDSTQLVRAADAVVATQSTMVLEAALARKPCIVIDTGNANCYQHVRLTRPEHLVDAVRTVVASSPNADAFRRHYFDLTLLGAGTRNTLQAIAAALNAPANRDPQRMGVALDRFSSTLSSYAADRIRVTRALSQAAIEAEELRRDLEKTRAELSVLAAQRAVADAKDEAVLEPRTDRRARVVLFGAASAGRERLRLIRTIPHLEPVAFVDNDSGRWGTRIDGVPVMAPTSHLFASVDAIVVTSVHVTSIAAQVAEAGFADRLVANVEIVERLARRVHFRPKVPSPFSAATA